MQLKSNKLAAVLGTAGSCQLFYFAAKNVKNSILLIFNEDSRLGSAIFVVLYLKNYCEKQKNTTFVIIII